MSLAELLSKKKTALAPTETKDNSSIALAEVECKSSEDYYRLMKDTQFEKYYDLIKPYTFKSTLFPLSLDSARAILDTYKLLHPSSSTSTSSATTSSTTTSAESHVPAPDLDSWRTNPALLSLAKLIDNAKAQHLSPTSDIFVRLSSRCPKDAAIGTHGVSVYRESKRRIERLNEEMNDPLTTEDNTKLHALYRMGTEALRLKEGIQAVELLVNSNRIQEDLLHYVNDTPNEEFNVVVREFADFEVELEFRAFVYGKKLTAITQYNQYCYFPRVVRNKELLLGIMKDFVEKELIPVVPLQNFVIDIMLVSLTPEQGTYTNLKVYIVEINPFAEFAGEGLFSWTNPKEVAILKGRASFEFRVVEKPPRDAIKLIAKEWSQFVHDADH